MDMVSMSLGNDLVLMEELTVIQTKLLGELQVGTESKRQANATHDDERNTSSKGAIDECWRVLEVGRCARWVGCKRYLGQVHYFHLLRSHLCNTMKY
jgi:hypothetical protein